MRGRAPGSGSAEGAAGGGVGAGNGPAAGAGGGVPVIAARACERVSFGGSDVLSSVLVATIAQGTDYSVSLVLRPATSGGGNAAYSLAVLEVSGNNPNVRALKPVPTLGVWSHVTMDFNLNALQAAVTVQVDANASERVTLSPSAGALATTSVRSLGVGVTVTGPVADYSARVDNVTYSLK